MEEGQRPLRMEISTVATISRELPTGMEPTSGRTAPSMWGTLSKVSSMGLVSGRKTKLLSSPTRMKESTNMIRSVARELMYGHLAMCT